MDMQILTTMIGSIGFPIVACIFMAIFLNKMNENYRMDVKDLSANHKDEMNKVVEAINNNNKLLERVLDRLDVLDRNDKEGDV